MKLSIRINKHMFNRFFFTFIIIFFFSCKKDTLVEVVDVPATPIKIVKVEGGTGNASDVKANEGSFKMFVLPYGYKDLEPHFDASTIEIHYSKHHLNFVNNLNKAVLGTKYEFLNLRDIHKNLNLTDIDVRNNAGGYYNHNFYWENLSPKPTSEPEGQLMEDIKRDFGSFEEFKAQFTSIAANYFGSGWAWLVYDKIGKLKIMTTPNNDNPLMRGIGGGTPLLNIDLWEHAHYLKFQNRKREYINTFYNVVNWKSVSEKYDAIPNKVDQSIQVKAETEKPAIQEEQKLDEFN
jgi:superoxide dismutase, Fe-Mn family